MSPKSLLRHPLCVSDLSEFEEGKAFQEVIDDANVKATDVRKVLYCTGKIYYDLLKHQTETQNKEVAIVRLEQIYPFPSTQIEAIKKKYAKAKAHIWVQEESLNMGAWSYLKTFQTDFCQEVIGRDESASPATGYMKIHVQQQESIVSKALS
jgi:2-oxoglutarate dehydrogenase E1 component